MKSSLIHLLGATGICTIVIVVYAISYSAISDKSQEVASLQAQITTATETASRITQARATLAEVATDEAKIQGYFVPETAVVTLINNLEKLGLTQGAEVKISSVAKGGTATKPTLLLSLTAKGTFDAVMRTIGAIEYAPFAISISSASIEQDAKNAWHADLNMSIGSLSASPATATTL